MKRLVSIIFMLTCLIGLLVTLSIRTPAQTKDPQGSNSGKMAEEPRSAAVATTSATTSSDRNSDSEKRRGGDEKAENGSGDQDSLRSAQPKQSSLALKSAPDQGAQATGQAKGNNNKEEEKNRELVIAPYPISSPAIGTGLQWVAGYVFKMNKEDKVTPASFLGTAGMYTNNGSWGMLFGGSLHLKEDKYRLAAGVATGNVNFDFFGIGKIAGDRGVFLPINVNGKGFLVQTLFRIVKNLYIGPRFQVRKLDASIDFSALKIPDLPEEIERLPQDIVEAVPRDLLRTTTVALGPHLQRDTRNDQFYPTKGTVLNVGTDFFLKGLGSKFNYQLYQVRFEGYRSLSERQVLAFGSLGCAAAGDRVPFYDLCLYGSRNYVRGYPAGRFQDRRMLATQLEYRLRLPKLMGIGFTERFGVVGFGGVGWVGKQLGDLAFEDLLPGGGGGLRFRLTKKYPINFRIDYGIGRVGQTVSMGVGEAF